LEKGGKEGEKGANEEKGKMGKKGGAREKESEIKKRRAEGRNRLMGRIEKGRVWENGDSRGEEDE
jgi:hypothetical protein